MRKSVNILLTAGSMIGVAATAVTAIRAYDRTRSYIEQLDMTLDEVFKDKETALNVLKGTWKDWAICGGSLLATEGCIAANNAGHLKTEAALACVAASLGTQLKKIDRGMIEQIGTEKWREFKGAIAAKDAEKANMKIDEPKDGLENYLDSVTGQKFQAREIDILRTEVEMNRAFCEKGEVSVAEYICFFNNYDLLIAPGDDDIGWYMDNSNTWEDKFKEGKYTYHICLGVTEEIIDGKKVKVVTPDIAPSDPTEEWRDYVQHEYLKYSPEPQDLIEST